LFKIQVVPVAGAGSVLFNPFASYSWEIGHVVRQISVNGIDTNLDVSKFAAAINLDTSALGEPSTDFSFSLAPNGDGTDNLFLNYQGLPEPGSAALFGLGIAAPLLGRRKRPPRKPA
jgi:hypothetical protein